MVSKVCPPATSRSTESSASSAGAPYTSRASKRASRRLSDTSPTAICSALALPFTPWRPPSFVSVRPASSDPFAGTRMSGAMSSRLPAAIVSEPCASFCASSRRSPVARTEPMARSRPWMASSLPARPVTCARPRAGLRSTSPARETVASRAPVRSLATMSSASRGTGRPSIRAFSTLTLAARSGLRSVPVSFAWAAARPDSLSSASFRSGTARFALRSARSSVARPSAVRVTCRPSIRKPSNA